MHPPAEHLDDVMIARRRAEVVDECLSAIIANLPALTSLSQGLMIRTVLERLFDQARRSEQRSNRPATQACPAWT